MRIRNFYHPVLALLALCLASLSSPAQTSFTVISSGFTAYNINSVNNPTLTLTRGVTYQFNVNASGHPFWIKTAATIGTSDVYNSGVTGNGVQVGTLTFVVPLNAPSNLFYICQFHSSMRGTINIVSPASPPTVALTNPASGTTLAAPANLILRASASDMDGSVTNVQFFSGTTLLGNDTATPYLLTITNLAAGVYEFKARATDNTGLSSTSSLVTVSVVDPGIISFENSPALVQAQLPLRVNVTPGLRYTIEYTSTLADWLVFTNFVATNSTMSFRSPTAASNQLFFRALLLPNP